MMKLEKNWKIDKLNWEFLKFKWLIVQEAIIQRIEFL
jgi:hypothetical protein